MSPSLDEEYVVIFALASVIIGMTLVLCKTISKIKSQEDRLYKQSVRIAMLHNQINRNVSAKASKAMWN